MKKIIDQVFQVKYMHVTDQQMLGITIFKSTTHKYVFCESSIKHQRWKKHLSTSERRTYVVNIIKTNIYPLFPLTRNFRLNLTWFPIWKRGQYYERVNLILPFKLANTAYTHIHFLRFAYMWSALSYLRDKLPLWENFELTHVIKQHDVAAVPLQETD